MNGGSFVVFLLLSAVSLLASLVAIAQYLHRGEKSIYTTVHCYWVDGLVTTSMWKDKDEAINFARRIFGNPEVYKVKVWKGKPTPNVKEDSNLIFEIV